MKTLHTNPYHDHISSQVLYVSLCLFILVSLYQDTHAQARRGANTRHNRNTQHTQSNSRRQRLRVRIQNNNTDHSVEARTSHRAGTAERVRPHTNTPPSTTSNTAPSPPTENTDSIPPLEDTDPIPPTEDTNPIPSTEDTDPIPPTEDTNPIPSTEDTNPIPPTEDTNPIPPTEDTNPIPPTEDTDPTPAIEEVINTIDIRKSLMVTDQAITQSFTLQRTLNQLLAQTEDVSTATDLYQEWWATQLTNDQNGPDSIRCDDELTAGQASLNGFPIVCSRAEGQLAHEDPFNGQQESAYTAIALVNRFDLADEGSDSCGEYRIVYALNSGRTQNNRRNLLIFEAQLPNPSPECGIDACAPVAEFWAHLSQESDPQVRASLLEMFYYEGLPGFAPAIHVNHFTANTGQIRTNQFLDTTWTLKEFKLIYDCGTGDCNLSVVPVPVAASPAPELLLNNNDQRTLAFQEYFPSQVPALAATSLAQLSMEIPEDFYASENISSRGSLFDLTQTARRSSPTFRQAITNAIPEDSTLTVDHIMNRATALTCAGCHQISNRNHPLGGGLNWPVSLGFVHISEQRVNQDTGPDGMRFGISPALSDVFLPLRLQNLTNFLTTFNSNDTSCEPFSDVELESQTDATPIREMPTSPTQTEAPLTQDEMMQILVRNRRVDRMMMVH